MADEELPEEGEKAQETPAEEELAEEEFAEEGVATEGFAEEGEAVQGVGAVNFIGAESMSEEELATLRQEYDKIQEELGGLSLDARDYYLIEDMDLIRAVYYLWIHWANFHVYLDDFGYLYISPPRYIEPEPHENVYRIADYGDHFSTSPGEHLLAGTRSTGKLFKTIEKMMQLAVERAREAGSGGGETPEIRVSFSGHELGQRKAFKYCIMSKDNLVVTNFDPGEWGELQLKVMDTLAQKGYLPGLESS